MLEQKENKIRPENVFGPVAEPPMAGNVLTPKEILMMFRQHLLLIIIFTVFGLLLGGGSWFLLSTLQPRYTAETYIEVLPVAEQNPTEIVPYVVNKDIQYIYRQSLTALIRQQSTFSELLKRDKIRQSDWFKNFGKSGSGESAARSVDNALRDLNSNFRAVAERDADFIRVAMTCGNKEEAALIVNEMVDVFLKYRQVDEGQSITERLTALNEQKTSVERELTQTQTVLNGIRADTGFYDLDQHNYMDTFTQRLADLNLAYNDLILDVTNTQATIRALQRQASGPITEQISRMVESDPVVLTLTQQKKLLESTLASRLAKYGENHRVVSQIREQIDEIEAQRQERAGEIGELIRKSNLQNGQDALAILQERLTELNKQKQEAEEKKRDLDLARVRYEDNVLKREGIMNRLEDINGSIEIYQVKSRDPEATKIKKIGDAPVPLDMSFPKWQVFIPGGVLLGLFLGLGVAFLIESMNDLVRTSRDITRFLPVRFLGYIPNFNEDVMLDGIEPKLAVNKAPYSMVSECYRRLRSTLKLSIPAGAKSILVSSGSAGEGKTSIAVNLGLSFAAQGNKVLLIDANFWRPNLNTIFPKKAGGVARQAIPKDSEPKISGEEEENNGNYELGLSTVLAGLCGYHEVIRPSGIENCDVVDAGMLPPNPAEMLGSPQMEQFIKHQSDKYDYVIIDSPPVLLVGDLKTLAQIVDGTILVFNAASTTRGTAFRTIRELSQVDVQIFGCVLVGVKWIKGGYFRKQYRSYSNYQKLQLAHT